MMLSNNINVQEQKKSYARYVIRKNYHMLFYVLQLTSRIFIYLENCAETDGRESELFAIFERIL